jgi:diguanylate cyclase with GGDEF domain
MQEVYNRIPYEGAGRDNESYGHLAGDEVLRKVAGTISSRCRGGDTASRPTSRVQPRLTAVLSSGSDGDQEPLVLDGAKPILMANRAAWVRSETPSLEIIRCTWVLTVPTLRYSLSEIC